MNKLLKSKINYPVFLFLAWRLAIIFFQITIEPFLFSGPRADTFQELLLTSWTTYWDAGHYHNIALYGYSYPDQAFFPIWPTLLKIFNSTGLPFEITSYILTFTTGLLVFILLYKLTKKITNENIAKKTLLLFCCYPGSIFLIASYSEGIYLILVLISFILMEKNKLILASLVGGIASAARITGTFLSFIIALNPSSISKKIVYLTLGSLGILFYMLFLFIKFNDPLMFLHAQKAWCLNNELFSCSYKFPLATLLDYKEIQAKPYLMIDYVYTLASVILLTIGVYSKSLKKEYLIFAFLSLLLPLTYGRIVSMTRFVLPIFPLYIIAAILLTKRTTFYYKLLVIMLGLNQLIFVTLFTNFNFVG